MTLIVINLRLDALLLQVMLGVLLEHVLIIQEHILMYSVMLG